MTLQELKNRVCQEFDRRKLKSNARYNALEKVVEYILKKHNGNLEVLFNPKDDFKNLYERHKGSDINSAESSAINEMYNQLNSKSSYSSTKPLIESLMSTTKNLTTNDEISTSNTEELMIVNNFMKVSILTESIIPNEPGLYAIRIKDVNDLPAPFCDELIKRNHDLLYIGMASESLRKRLWKQELNHEKPATFFRSIGAILGYRPVNGSLVGKSNTTNYKFNQVDTDKIKKWIKEHLLVNCVVVSACPKTEDNKKFIEDIEKQLIQTYRPIINIKDNPYKMEKMSELRNECHRIANEQMCL